VTANSFVLLATTNPAKVQRLRSVIQTLGASCRTIADYPEFTSPSETGPSHEANAKLKAMYWSQACQGLAIASDGGMDIPALGSSWDSVFTNRATGTDSTDEDRRLRLLEIMKDLSGIERIARWKEAITLAFRGEVKHTWFAESSDGYISEEATSKNIPGFWMSSLWYFPEIGKFYSECSLEELGRVEDTWTKLQAAIQIDLQVES